MKRMLVVLGVLLVLGLAVSSLSASNSSTVIMSPLVGTFPLEEGDINWRVWINDEEQSWSLKYTSSQPSQYTEFDNDWLPISNSEFGQYVQFQGCRYRLLQVKPAALEVSEVVDCE